MRDIALITLTINDLSVLDIDIIDGEPDYLEEASQTNDQRAAVACYACKGTVPGMLDYGVSWGDVYTKDNTTMQLNNELQQQVQNYAGNSSEDYELTATQYSAQLLMSSEGIGVIVKRGA